MGYIGKKPSDVPLTSDDIADNIITSSKIVDDAVTSAKINDGTIVNADINDVAATKLTGSIADARVPASAVTQHVTATDLTPVRHDILTLALKQATQENSTKFNLPNSAITKFEADADFDLAGSTTIARHGDEYISSVTGTITKFIPQWLKVSTRTGTPLNSTQSGDNGTNDMIPNGVAHSGGVNYAMCGINEAWDLSNDFEFKAWSQTLSASAGTLSSILYAAASILMTTDTSVAAGSTPSGVFAGAASGALFNGNATHWSANILDSSYASTAGITSSTSDTAYDGVTAAQTVSAGSANKVVRAYWNDGSTALTGWQIIHTSATNTITLKGFVTDRTTLSSILPVTITNVPSAGRAYFLFGQAFTQARYYTTAAAGGVTASGDNSTKGASSVSATGTALGTTNVPTSAVTDVSGVMLMKNAYGTNTLGTDVKAYFTADNSNWTEAASYTDAGTFSTGIKMIKLGKTTCTSGSDVRWKIVWANQAASSKEAQIYGMGLNY